MEILINGRRFNGEIIDKTTFSAHLTSHCDFAFMRNFITNTSHMMKIPVVIVDNDELIEGYFLIARASSYDFYNRSKFTFKLETSLKRKIQTNTSVN